MVMKQQDDLDSGKAKGMLFSVGKPLCTQPTEHEIFKYRQMRQQQNAHWATVQEVRTLVDRLIGLKTKISGIGAHSEEDFLSIKDACLYELVQLEGLANICIESIRQGTGPDHSGFAPIGEIPF